MNPSWWESDHRPIDPFNDDIADVIEEWHFVNGYAAFTCCPAKSDDEYLCQLLYGHNGSHMAEGSDFDLLAIWED
jgi:hypothetical protein